MKKHLRLTALLLCLALLLSACGGRPAEDASSPAERHRTERAETPAPETPAVTEEPQPYTEPPVTPSPAPECAEVQVHVGETTEIEHVEFTGVSAGGQELWKRIFTTDYRTELTLIQPIGAWQDRFYLNHNGTVVCLRLSDGETLWENGDFGGASISGLIDKRNGSVYLCGWYGPDFFACDSEGNTLSFCGSATESCWWPSDMAWNGPDELVIWYHSEDPALPYYVDLSDFSISWTFDVRELRGASLYWANIFVSDFIEQGVSTFPRDGASDFELAHFVRLFCKINRQSAIRYIDGYETVGIDTVNELCRRFFGREIYPPEGVQTSELWHMEWRSETGRFYAPAADGEAYNAFAVVRDCLQLPGGDVRLRYDVYTLNLDEYWQSGMDGKLYSLSAAEAEAMAKTGRITKTGSGWAEATPVQQEGHDGYYLIRMERDPA